MVSDVGCPPVFIAGDLFDDGWRSNKCPPELVNFTIDILRNHYYYAIPGQHDLPLHNYQDIKKSAYWTLHRAKAIEDMIRCCSFYREDVDFHVHPFPWGEPLRTLTNDVKKATQHHSGKGRQIHIALVHKYIYYDKGHPGAPKDGSIKAIRKQLKGYDIVVTGDNHIPFFVGPAKPLIVNCGTQIRRKIDEQIIKPKCWLLTSSGDIIPHYWNISKDEWDETITLREESDADLVLCSHNFQQFVDTLKRTADTAIVFQEQLNHYMAQHQTSVEVRRQVLKAAGK